MRNITLSVEEDVLREVRKLAAERETTVNGLVRDYLGRLAQHRREGARARQELVRLSKASSWNPGQDWQWNRDELYDRPSVRGYQHSRLRGLKRSAKSRKKASGG